MTTRLNPYLSFRDTAREAMALPLGHQGERPQRCGERCFRVHATAAKNELRR